MSNLVAVAYPDEATAREVGQTLMELQKEHSIELDDLAIAVRQEDARARDGLSARQGSGRRRNAGRRPGGGSRASQGMSASSRARWTASRRPGASSLR